MQIIVKILNIFFFIAKTIIIVIHDVFLHIQFMSNDLGKIAGSGTGTLLKKRLVKRLREILFVAQRRRKVKKIFGS